METRVPVLWISGPPGAGKSTVSWQLFTDLARAGPHVAFADTDQFCMCYPAPPGDPDRPIESDEALRTYVRALPAARVIAVRLHAGRAELTRRIMTRGAGGGWPQPGDPLRGQPREVLLRAAGRAATEARVLERAAAGMVRIDTDGLTVTAAVDAIAAVVG